MNRATFLRTSLLTIGVTAFAGCAMHGPGGQHARNHSQRPAVVFQVSDNDPAKWNLALNNARNVQADYGADQVDIEIVAYGPGIHMLKADSVTSNRVAEAAKAGVNVVACQNTMDALKLTKTDMQASVGYVPAGVVEIMKRQKEGWSYVRP
ncbi:DsrE family protein [Hydrogenophaga sp. PAMC20947]|uniref:DsrE family protein n=1 Tax=Hydrogenophaga sp. PAMC20947 TaxID=2565558 RepID=UPI001FF86395|nr:DsrE family protein [Hydrogenophaga sp. PAMC20947]